MSYGMRIWGPTGSLELDENSFTVRVIYSGIVNSLNAGNTNFAYNIIQLPGVNPTDYTAVCIPNGLYVGDDFGQDAKNAQYEPQVVNNAVIIWFGNRNQSGGRLAQGPQRLLVMRYK